MLATDFLAVAPVRRDEAVDTFRDLPVLRELPVALDRVEADFALDLPPDVARVRPLPVLRALLDAVWRLTSLLKLLC